MFGFGSVCFALSLDFAQSGAVLVLLHSSACVLRATYTLARS